MKFWRQKNKTQNHSFGIFGAKISYKKRARKMLMKLTPRGSNHGIGPIVKPDLESKYQDCKKLGVNFINILRGPFLYESL